MRQTLALLLAGALTVGSFAGCGGSKAGGETAGTETAGTEAAGTAASGSDTPLVIANDGMSEKFSPFFVESVPDQNIVDVTQISLVYNDRSGEFIYNGIEGETTSYNGTDYTYYGPTDLTITENEDGTVYYDFNCAKEPFNNPLVRKALCLAIDREALINNVAQVEAQPAYSFLAPGYVVDGKDITEGRSDYGLSSTADVEGAKAALEEAGYPNGEGFPTVQLSFYSDDNVKKIAEAIAEMWQTNLGIQVEVTSSDWAVFYDAVQAGEYDVAAMGWSADYVNPMSFLPLLYTDDVSNNVFYSNKDYDAVVDQIKVEKDSTKFAELVMQADEIASNEYPVLPLYYKSNNYLLKDYVKGVYMTSSSNIYFKDAQVLAH